MIFEQADAKKFAIYHTIYTAANIFQRFDWNERVDDALGNVSAGAYFMYEDEKIVGGFTMKENCINYPFIVAPFDNRRVFWKAVLDFTSEHNKNGVEENENSSNFGENSESNSGIFLNEIPEADALVLTKNFGANLRWSKRKMLRPTEEFAPTEDDDFFYEAVEISDIDEIVSAIFEAHASGHTASFWQPDVNIIKTSLKKRFDAFGQTSSLHMGSIVRAIRNNKIAGVCIAGIYPGEKFATLHQVAVRPAFRRRGVATAMIQKAITSAAEVAPVMTVGVLVDNPSVGLYSRLGFKPGSIYSELLYYNAI